VFGAIRFFAILDGSEGHVRVMETSHTGAKKAKLIAVPSLDDEVQAPPAVPAQFTLSRGLSLSVGVSSSSPAVVPPPVAPATTIAPGASLTLSAVASVSGARGTDTSSKQLQSSAQVVVSVRQKDNRMLGSLKNVQYTFSDKVSSDFHINQVDWCWHLSSVSADLIARMLESCS
jgi:hypothetical protein